MHIHSVKTLPFLFLLTTISCYGQNEQIGVVTRVIDGDTIDIDIGSKVHRVRYIGMNTPERDEPCFDEATEANIDLVAGKTVKLVKDVSETDRYGRLLRYVYVGDIFVNQSLVAEGFAEAVLYKPDDRHFRLFSDLEKVAADAGVGCHRTGVFYDESASR